jgi:hypothetical protein
MGLLQGCVQWQVFVLMVYSVYRHNWMSDSVAKCPLFRMCRHLYSVNICCFLSLCHILIPYQSLTECRYIVISRVVSYSEGSGSNIPLHMAILSGLLCVSLLLSVKYFDWCLKID